MSRKMVTIIEITSVKKVIITGVRSGFGEAKLQHGNASETQAFNQTPACGTRGIMDGV